MATWGSRGFHNFRSQYKGIQVAPSRPFVFLSNTKIAPISPLRREALPGVRFFISLQGHFLNGQLLLSSRVAPKTAQLKVQMELCVALMDVRLFALLHRAHASHCQIFLWTDSNAVLTRPKSSEKFHHWKSSHSVSYQPQISWLGHFKFLSCESVYYLKICPRGVRNFHRSTVWLTHKRGLLTENR